MGDRVSIQFKDEDGRLSPVLFSHWGGMDFVGTARKYVKDLREWTIKRKGISYPLSRMEAQTAMVDFIRHITRSMERVESDLYLGLSPQDGDNSDNGHHVISLRRNE